MRKYKIYLDTSVISHLEQPQKPYEMQASYAFWEIAEKGEFNIYLSDVVFEEIGKCGTELFEKLTEHLAEIDYTRINLTDEMGNLANKIIAAGVLPKKSIDDSRHIAAALAAECDYLLSWNMKHLANTDTNAGVRKIVLDEHYRELLIIPPNMLVLPEKSEKGDE